MSDYQGNIIIKNPATPSGPYEDGAAPGVWTLSEAMTFVKQGVWPTAGLASPDPYFKNVSLLLHGNGTNGAQNNTFTNSATGGGVSADQGIPIQGSFSPYGSNWSNYFDGTGDYLGVTPSALSTGDFTFECWIYATGTGQYQYLYDTRTSTNDAAGFCVIYNHASYPNQISIYSNGFIGTPTINVPANTWTHFALVRSSGSWRTFVNGVADIASTSASRTLSNTALKIGTGQALDYFFNGYLSNYRIVTSAVYTSAFTPSTTPLTAITNTSLLTCQSNRFRDASTNNLTITRYGDTKVLNFAPFAPSSAYSTTTNGGSAYFDPNNLDRLNITFNYYVGNTDFTWEGWAYLTTTASPKPLFSGKIGGSNIGFDLLFENGGRALIIVTSTDDVYTVAAASNINLHCWNHIALSRTSGTLSVYVNGVRTYNAGFSDPMANSFNLRIGGTYDYYGESWYYFPGYLSDVRYSKTGRYSGTTITVPTAPLTNDANTLGLLNFTNAGIFDNSMHNNLRTVGNAKISTAVSKFGGSSIAFDGSGDWLDLQQNNPVNWLGSGDFTVEFWVYGNSWSTSPVLLEYGRQGASGTPGIEFWVSTTGGKLDVYGGSTTGVLLASYSNLPTTTWTHVALTRASGANRLFINGIQSGTATTDTANYTQAFIRIGAFVNGSNSLNGYIDDLRVTNGVARYTANFTPPTKAFPDT